MATTQYIPGNRFTDWVNIADAAVEWQALGPEQQALVVVEDGLPYLAGVPDLKHRGEALLDAAQRGRLTGQTHNEDGNPLRAGLMRLDRAAVAEFTVLAGKPSVVQQEPNVPADRLLTQEELEQRTGLSRATIARRRNTGEIEQPHATKPNRWRESYVNRLVAGDDI